MKTPKLNRKTWLWLGVGAAAVGVYVLFTRSGGGGGGGVASPSPIGSSTGMPDPNQSGGWFNSSEQAASGYANYYQNQQGVVQRALDTLGGYVGGAKYNGGLYEEAPGGFVNTGKKNAAAAGTFISNEAAQQLGAQNRGPLAKGKSFFDKVGEFLGAVTKGYQTGGISAAQGYYPYSPTLSGGSIPGINGDVKIAALRSRQVAYINPDGIK